jgi:glycosyltransferase involved in cell wall biosynthesis
MSSKTFTLVTTTIRVPQLLRDYAKDAINHGRKLERMIVIGDKKTPGEVESFCAQVQSETRVPCRYVSPEAQERYLERFPAFGTFLPWNCIQRRNVGLLMAYDEGSDIVVTIDDDNLISQPDYFGKHEHLGDTIDLDIVSHDSGWWNVCEMLVEEHGFPFYHRGHPLSKRWTGGDFKTHKAKGRSVVNAGLWLEEPDIDAVTRLCHPVRVLSRNSKFPEWLACNKGTWAPFNSQNTALLREVIPGYLLFPYVGRYDDIWASYVVRHITDHLNDYVTYGAPMVRQERNPHNYFVDFDAERLGLERNDIFLGALKACVLSGRTYREAFAQIAEQLPSQLSQECQRGKVDPSLFSRLLEGMKLWRGIFEK